MKVRNSWPFMAACMGRRIVHSPPRKPAASPAKKLDTASAHSSAAMGTPSTLGVVMIEKYGKGRNCCQAESPVPPSKGTKRCLSLHSRRSSLGRPAHRTSTGVAMTPPAGMAHQLVDHPRGYRRPPARSRRCGGSWGHVARDAPGPRRRRRPRRGQPACPPPTRPAPST